MRKRIKWVDIAKGIAILLVIAGHTFTANDFGLRGMIFSFHMPLFFVLSGITFHMSEDKTAFARRAWKRARHLVLPAVALYLTRALLIAAVKRERVIPRDLLRAILYASGVAFGPENAGTGAMGAVWFLFALFIVEEVADGFHLLARRFDRRQRDVAMWFFAAATAVFGVGVGKYLFFSADIAAAALIFFCFGYRFSGRPARWWQGAIWAACTLGVYRLCGRHLEMATRDYPLFPICHIGAIAGSYFVIWTAMKLEARGGELSDLFSRVGEHSFVLYGVHYMDMFWRSVWENAAIAALPGRAGFPVLVRVAVDVSLMFCLTAAKRLLAERKTSA